MLLLELLDLLLELELDLKLLLELELQLLDPQHPEAGRRALLRLPPDAPAAPQ